MSGFRVQGLPFRVQGLVFACSDLELHLEPHSGSRFG